MKMIDYHLDGSRTVTEWDDETGLGTVALFDALGNQVSVDDVVDMPTPEAGPAERIRALEQTVEQLLAALTQEEPDE